MDFYHGTDELTAEIIAAGAPVLGSGHGEFGAGFYTFMEEAAAEIAAATYTRNRGLPEWGVVDFEVPSDVLVEYGLASAVFGGLDSVLIFPDRDTPVTVRYPIDLGGFETTMSWREFVQQNRDLGHHVEWPYDLIVGPLSGRLRGYRRDVDQFVFQQLWRHDAQRPARRPRGLQRWVHLMAQ